MNNSAVVTLPLQDAGSVDFVIVGSGIAGLYTAILLTRHGRVAVLSKQDLIAGNTWLAQGGIAAAISPEDSPAIHLEDTWQAGACFGDRRAIGVLVEQAPDRINDLLQMGVNFDRRNSAIDLSREGAHSRKRILHIGGDATGRNLVEALLRESRERGVHFLENAFVYRLLVEDQCCYGLCYQVAGKRYLLKARAVILATGGCGQIFQFTSNAPAVTGDGLALAYRAGAVLKDLEFFQFHPTVFFPPGDRPFLISETVRGEGGYLVNKDGERFMHRYHPQAELGPRDIVARAILSEKIRTGSQICLDLRHLGKDYLWQRFPTVSANCRKYGLEVSRDLIPVEPAAHYLIGGIEVDLYGRTAVENLFAVGEVASTGVHGANRLASNSLLEGLVFGHLAAQAAGKAVARRKADPRILLQETVTADQRIEEECLSLRPRLQQLMWEKVGLLRNEAGMKEALELFKQWEPLLEYRFSGVESCENQNMLLIGILMTRAALARRHSIGCHYREDYPGIAPGTAQKHTLMAMA